MAMSVQSNTPSTGYIQWTGVSISYKGQTYAITNGNTNLAYVYWLYATPTAFQTSNTYPSSLGNDDLLVFVNKFGAALTVPNTTVLDGSLIVPQSLTANAIAADTITGLQIAANTITASEMAAGSVTANAIAANAVTASAIQAGAITANALAANSVTSAAILAGAVTANAIAANAVVATNIAAGAVTANAIAANTITASMINSLNGLNVGSGNLVIDGSGNVTIKGTLNGATGTFAGTLSADTMTIQPASGANGVINMYAGSSNWVSIVSATGGITAITLGKNYNNSTHAISNLDQMYINANTTYFSGVLDMGSKNIQMASGLSFSGANTINFDIYGNIHALGIVGYWNIRNNDDTVMTEFNFDPTLPIKFHKGLVLDGGTNALQLTATANTTSAFASWYDGSTRLGYIGKSTATVQNISLTAEVADLVLQAGPGRVWIRTTSGTGYIQMGTHVQPDTDNNWYLGLAANRWKAVYSATATIQTSDERAKQQIEPIPDTWLDAWSEVEFVKYKFNESVALKGDNARWHIGLIAQRIEEIFKNHGIDAFTIGLLCYDEWVDENGQQQDRYGVRFDECQFMEMALTRRELTKLKGVA